MSAEKKIELFLELLKVLNTEADYEYREHIKKGLARYLIELNMVD